MAGRPGQSGCGCGRFLLGLEHRGQRAAFGRPDRSAECLDHRISNSDQWHLGAWFHPVEVKSDDATRQRHQRRSGSVDGSMGFPNGFVAGPLRRRLTAADLSADESVIYARCLPSSQCEVRGTSGIECWHVHFRFAHGRSGRGIRHRQHNRPRFHLHAQQLHVRGHGQSNRKSGKCAVRRSGCEPCGRAVFIHRRACCAKRGSDSVIDGFWGSRRIFRPINPGNPANRSYARAVAAFPVLQPGCPV